MNGPWDTFPLNLGTRCGNTYTRVPTRSREQYIFTVLSMTDQTLDVLEAQVKLRDDTPMLEINENSPFPVRYRYLSCVLSSQSNHPDLHLHLPNVRDHTRSTSGTPCLAGGK